jgi:hypothetical protein
MTAPESQVGVVDYCTIRLVAVIVLRDGVMALVGSSCVLFLGRGVGLYSADAHCLLLA